MGTAFFGTSRNGRSVSVRGSLGILSTRSEMMFFWISSVPPAIEMAGVETRISAMRPFIGTIRAGEHRVGPADQRVHLVGGAGDVARRQLAERAFGPLRTPLLMRRPRPPRGPLGAARHDHQLGDFLANDRIGILAGLLGALDDQIDPTGALGIPFVGLQIDLDLLGFLAIDPLRAARTA